MRIYLLDRVLIRLRLELNNVYRVSENPVVSVLIEDMLTIRRDSAGCAFPDFLCALDRE